MEGWNMWLLLVLLFSWSVAAVNAEQNTAISVTTHSQNVFTGEMAALECRVRDTEGKEVMWGKMDADDPSVKTLISHGKKLLVEDRDRYTLDVFTTNSNITVYRLKIRDIQTSDSGVYQCRVQNLLMELEGDASRPVEIQVYPKKEDTGAALSATTEATGKPKKNASVNNQPGSSRDSEASWGKSPPSWTILLPLLVRLVTQ